MLASLCFVLVLMLAFITFIMVIIHCGGIRCGSICHHGLWWQSFGIVVRGGSHSLWLHSSWWHYIMVVCHGVVMVDLFIWHVVVTPITSSTTVK